MKTAREILFKHGYLADDNGIVIKAMEEYSEQIEPKWISTKILPSHKGEYLGFNQITGRPVIAECYESIGDEKLTLKFQDYISHWMPLPKKPVI